MSCAPPQEDFPYDETLVHPPSPCMPLSEDKAPPTNSNSDFKFSLVIVDLSGGAAVTTLAADELQVQALSFILTSTPPAFSLASRNWPEAILLELMSDLPAAFAHETYRIAPGATILILGYAPAGCAHDTINAIFSSTDLISGDGNFDCSFIFCTSGPASDTGSLAVKGQSLEQLTTNDSSLGPIELQRKWLYHNVRWPSESFEVKEHEPHSGRGVSISPTAYDRTEWSNALLNGWEPAVSYPKIAANHDLVSLQARHGDISRPLIPDELERLLGLEGTYTFLQGPKDADLCAAQAHRRDLICQSWPLMWSKLFIIASLPCGTVQAPKQCSLRPAEPCLNWWNNLGIISGGPDDRELSATSRLAMTMGAQAKSDLAPGGGTSLLPKGLTPEQHFLCGTVASSPRLAGINLTADLDFATTKTIELGRKARYWRRRVLTALQSQCALTEDSVNAMLDAGRSDTSRRIAPKVNLARIKFVTEIIGWPDDVCGLMQLGGNIVGDIASTSVFRPIERPASLDILELLATSEEWIRQIQNSAPPRTEEATIIWQKSMEDIKKGHLRGPFTKCQMDAKWGAGRWRPIKRFAIWQVNGRKWRQIDNARASLHNEATGASERIHTTSNGVSCSIYRRMRELLKGPLVGEFAPLGATEDMDDAYHQIPRADCDAPFAIVAIWCPCSKAWLFAEEDALLFGLASAVLHFNRVPAFIVAAARRILAIATTAFYDDFRTHDVAGAGCAARFFRAFVEWLGFSLSKKKRQDPTPCPVFLGNTEDYLLAGQDVALMRPARDRDLNLQAEIAEAISKRSCPSGLAASLLGKWIQLSQVYACGLSKGHLQGIIQATAGDDKWSNKLLQSLQRLQAAITNGKPRTIMLHPVKDRRVAAWTDASFYLSGSEGVAKLCYIFVDGNSGIATGGTCRIPAWFLETLPERGSQILVAELVAPMVMIYYEKEAFTNVSGVAFIDNMAALCALASGSSKVADVDALSYAVRLWSLKLACDLWWEYVPSPSNIADGGSRAGVTDEVAAAAGITLREVTFPPFPIWSTASPETWLGLV